MRKLIAVMAVLAAGAVVLVLRSQSGTSRLTASQRDCGPARALIEVGQTVPGTCKVEPLASAITRAHQAILGGAPKPAAPPFSSMWRDINCFNEMRIPAITYGPGISVGGGNFGMKIADLVTGARLYALTALDLCNQER